MNRFPVAVSIIGPSFSEAFEQCEKAKENGADILEPRFDAINKEEIQQVSFLFPSIPRIFTARKMKEAGGDYRFGWRYGENERLEFLQRAIDSNIDYVSVELSTLKSGRVLVKRNSRSKLIVDYHDWIKTPSIDELVKMYREAKELGADIFKVASSTDEKNGERDCAKILRFVEVYGKNKDIVAIAMGKYGESTRALSPLYGSPFTFARVGEGSAPGQPTISELNESWSKLDRVTRAWRIGRY